MGTNDVGGDSHYRTNDMYYAAYLVVAEVPLVDTVRDAGRVVFRFEAAAPAVMRELKNEYFSGHAKVSALGYKQAIQTMKQLTHM